MRMMRIRIPAVVTACAVLLVASDGAAYRMIQNTNAGRTSTGVKVQCTDAGGFVHWNRTQIDIKLNPANQGGESGVTLALQHAMASWTSVTPRAIS
jgi:hypothetical protein